MNVYHTWYIVLRDYHELRGLQARRMATPAGAPHPPMSPGEGSVHSSPSLKNLGSKVVKHIHGKRVGSPPSGKASDRPDQQHHHHHAADAGGMAGGVGFGGSILGEVLASYSMSTLPPSKRHSISATSAHFEELAAEAGIDVEAEEINIEDLRMYRMDEDCGYTQDDDDSDGDGDNNGAAGDNKHHLHDDANAGNQKLAHKERSILQMVDVLSDRLTSLNAVVINRYNGCKSDLDEATEFRSSRTKKMAVAAEGEWSSSTPRRGVDKAKRGALFSQGGEGGEGGDAVGPSRMTFRNAPQTDAGRKLAHQFEQEYGAKQTSSATPKFNKTCSTKLKRVDHYKKSESRKHERIHFERKLQSNLDQYVTRAVTELVYRTPEDAEDVGSGPENHGNSQDDAPPPADAAGLGDGAHAPGGTSELIAQEHFPIPMEPNEMNPKLLLSYACERTVLPGGTRMFKHFATSTESQHLFVYVFWFIHCKFFQEDSRREQAHLLRAVAGRYVGVLGTEGMEEYKDFFFKHYPFLVANAVFWGFHYLCPGSRHLYSNAFKRVLYLQCARILSGIEITPSSTTEMRTKLFPDETAEAQDELEYHPHHVHTTGSRPAGGGGGVGAGSGGALPPAGVPPPSDAAIGGATGDRVSASPGMGPGKKNGRKGAAEGASAVADAVGSGAGRGETEGGKSGGDGGTMMQRMNKTFRPNPLGAYTGDRSTLRFKPRRQEGSTMLRPRQQRTVFDASQISPMLQEYLRQSSSTAGRRPENIVRTVPVPWCQSGGSDTYRRHPSRKDVYDAIKSEHTKAKKEYARSKAQAAETLRRTLRHADADRQAIFKKGPRQVGLKSMDIVTDLQQHGAFKGFKRLHQ